MRYDVNRLEQQGREIMHRYPQRQLRTNHILEVDDNSRDKYSMGISLFNIGVIIGYRIAKAESKEGQREGRT